MRRIQEKENSELLFVKYIKYSYNATLSNSTKESHYIELHQLLRWSMINDDIR